MAEEIIHNKKYLSLQDVAKILSKNQAALRARIKRGNLKAIQSPMLASGKSSARFRYMIPLEAVKRELEGIVRRDAVLQYPLDENEEPNLYQTLCEILSKNRVGLTLADLRWQLERFQGLSLSQESVGEFLDLFSEFSNEEGRYTLRHPVPYEADVAKRMPIVREEIQKPSENLAVEDARAILQEYGQRISALESKLQILIDLLSKKLQS